MNTQTYAERARKHRHPLARELLELMERKQSNLCLSVDVTKSDEIIRIVETAAPFLCMVKVGCGQDQQACCAEVMQSDAY